MKGIDLSSNNVVTLPMLKAWKAAGYDFVVHRLTVGTWVDPTFAERWEWFEEAGFLRSTYHVTLPLTNIKNQCDAFFDALGDRRPDFPVTLDDEVIYDRNAGRNATPSETDACTALHVAEFNHFFGRKPLIYVNQHYASVYLKSNHGCNLWLAWPGPGGAYNTAQAPVVPDHWTRDQLLFWQRSWTQKLPLSVKSYDLDEWQGTEQEFREWAGLEMPMLDRVKKLEAQMEYALNEIERLGGYHAGNSGGR